MGLKAGKSEEWTAPVNSFIKRRWWSQEGRGSDSHQAFYICTNAFLGTQLPEQMMAVSAAFNIFQAEALGTLTVPKGHWWRGFIAPEVQQRKSNYFSREILPSDLFSDYFN